MYLGRLDTMDCLCGQKGKEEGDRRREWGKEKCEGGEKGGGKGAEERGKRGQRGRDVFIFLEDQLIEEFTWPLAQLL